MTNDMTATIQRGKGQPRPLVVDVPHGRRITLERPGQRSADHIQFTTHEDAIAFACRLLMTQTPTTLANSASLGDALLIVNAARKAFAAPEDINL
jgi:hypothetical protein